MNAPKIAKQYAMWVDERVKTFADQIRTEWEPAEAYIQVNGLFVTFNFDGKRICRRKSAMDASPCREADERRNIDRGNKDDLSPEMWNVDRLYKKTCRKLLGRDYPKMRYAQPLLIACVDVNGTRYGNNPEEIKNTHVHSIWLFQKSQIGAARSFLEQAELSENFDFRQICIKSVDKVGGGGGTDGVSGYVAKFLGHNALDPRIIDDCRIYPRSNSATG